MNKLILLLISLLGFLYNCNSEIQTILSSKNILPSISNGNKKIDNNSLITMFATFGFNFQSGAKLYNYIFSNIDINNSTLLFNIKDSIEFKSFGAMNIAVGYVSTKDNIDNILNIIQSCIDYSYKNNVQTKLILINENKSIRNEVASIVQSMITDLQTSPIELITFHLNDPTQSNDDAILTEVKDLIQSSILSAKKEKLKDITDRTDALKVGSSSMKINNVVSDSIQILQTLTEDFNDIVEASIKKIFSETMASTGATVISTIEVLHHIIEDQITKHYEKHNEIFVLHKNSDAIKAASYQSRLELSNALLPVYRSLIDIILQGSQEAFDKRMTRLPAVKRLPFMLKTLSENSLKSFLQNIVSIRSEFLKIITLETKEGLFSSEYSPISCKWIPTTSLQSLKPKLSSFKQKQSVIWWQTQYQNELEIEKFKNYMIQRSEERVNTLFLGGSYNPYVRDSPFPPTHINLNYLIDPKSISMNTEYSKLYDEHKEGPCETRADPLIIPGVARFPFNPNQNPISTETTEPWWKLIKDFIFDEN